MTFEEYIQNPLGKQNAVLNSITRESMRTVYSHKFDNILLRENNKIEYYLFKDQGTNTYWAYIKIPSEVVKKFYYDVVLKFTASEKVKGGGSNLFKYNVQFYSNDPAFVFTYAYVFNKEKMFIKELANKMSRQALTQKPKDKNKKELVGYVKSLYFAYLFMENRSLNKTSKFEAETISIKNLPPLLKNITHADIKVEDRQNQKVSKKKKSLLSQRDAQEIERITGRKVDDSKFKVTSTAKLGTVKNSAIVQNTKKSKFSVRKSKRK